MSTPNDELGELNRTIWELRCRLAYEELPKAQRFDVMSQLETACFQFAEGKEMYRIAHTIQEAMDSGMIETAVATQDLGECPLCFEEIPKTFPATTCLKRLTTHHRFFCCGVVTCVPCIEQRHQRMLHSMKQVVASPEENSQLGMEVHRELSNMKQCPFCRSPNHGREHLLAQVRRNAEAGKPWAQSMLGASMVDGWMGTNIVTTDRYGSLKWFQPAADKGDFTSLQYLAGLWEEGFPEIGIPPDMDKVRDYTLRSARKGYWFAQFGYPLLPHGETEVFTWLMLCAAQGLASAQTQLGKAPWNVYLDYAKSEIVGDQLSHDVSVHTPLFACIYWLRKAALQCDTEAQTLLPIVLLKAKAWIFGKVDIAGHSAIPEACFWFDLAEGETKRSDRPELLQILLKCARCGKRSSDNVQMKRCTKCKGAAYCGKECQTKHWKMGHKRDCKTIEDYRNSLEVPSQDGYVYPVQYSDPQSAVP